MFPIEDELKIPYVSKDIVEYLDQVFGVDTLMLYKAANNDELAGYIKGAREVILRLKHLSEDREA